MVFTVFNKDALIDALSKRPEKFNNIFTTLAAAEKRQSLTEVSAGTTGPGGGEAAAVDSPLRIMSVDQWERELQAANGERKYWKEAYAYYSDELFPFDITITLHNEYGQAAAFSILGVEILNEGSGMSIDDISTEKACTFVARGLTRLRPVFGTGKNNH